MVPKKWNSSGGAMSKTRDKVSAKSGVIPPHAPSEMYRISRPTRISDLDQSTLVPRRLWQCYQRLIALSGVGLPLSQVIKHALRPYGSTLVVEPCDLLLLGRATG